MSTRINLWAADHGSSHEPGGSDAVSLPVQTALVDYTASGRVTNTVYRNTTGNPLLVMVVGSRGSDVSLVTGHIEDVTPPTVMVASCLLPATRDASITILVPNNYYYKVIVVDVIVSWTEIEMFTT